MKVKVEIPNEIPALVKVTNAETGEIIRGVRSIKIETSAGGEENLLILEIIDFEAVIEAEPKIKTIRLDELNDER